MQEEYQRQLQALRTRQGTSLDLSQADYQICVAMAQQGYRREQLHEALEQASPEEPVRSAAKEYRYSGQVLDAVYAHPEVQRHLSAQASSEPQHRAQTSHIEPSPKVQTNERERHRERGLDLDMEL